MRKLFFILLLQIICLASNGQTFRFDPVGTHGQVMVHSDGAQFSAILGIPSDTSTVGIPVNKRSGLIAMVGGVYYYHNGSSWVTPAEGSSVVSVNGFFGAVNLTTTNIPEGLNLYFTDARVYNDSVLYLAYVKTLIAGKVGYADTAHMLLHYMRYGDSITVYATMYGLDTADTNIRTWANSRFLTSFSETDPFSFHKADSNTHGNAVTYDYLKNNYYPLGSNPAGYLITETDPIFTASIAYWLTALDTTHYNTAWLKYPSALSFNTTTGVLTVTRNDGSTITTNLDGRYLTSFSETDPVATAKTLTSSTGWGLTGTNSSQTIGSNPSITYAADSSQVATHGDVDSASNHIRTWALLTFGTGSGSVTSVSVVNANGFAGTVATATTTPAITITTTVNAPVVKGNGTALIPAVSGTDYQGPITLTTTGSSGAATFSGNTLNVPNYTASGLGAVTQVTVGPLSPIFTASTTTSGTTTGINFTISTVGAHKYLGNNTIVGGISPSYVSPVIADISNLGAGMATFLGTPNSVNLATTVSDYTGSPGSLVFSIGPAFTGLPSFAGGLALPSMNSTPATPATGVVHYSPSGNTNNCLFTNGFAFAMNGSNLTAIRTGTIPDHNFTYDNLSTLTTTTNGYFKGVLGLGTFVTSIPNGDLANSTINLNGVSTALGGSYNITHDSICANVTSLTPYSIAGQYLITYEDTALAGAITINNPAGTWQMKETLLITLKDNGTARAISFGTKFKNGSSSYPQLPTTTTLGKKEVLEFLRDNNTDIWDFVGMVDGLPY